MSGLSFDPAWLWLIGGVILLIAEVIAPGFFLIFIGAAAIATGLLTLAVGFAVALQLAVFAALAFLAVRIIGRRFYASRYDYTADPLLNNRVARLLGKVVVVVQTARGGPAAIGERVRIVDVEGNCLKVEPEHVLPPA